MATRVVAFRRGLHSGVGSVRALSAFQLGVVADTAAAPLLARRTLVDREAEVRSNALRAYERLSLHTPDDVAIGPFVRALAVDHHPVLRMRAAEALGSLGRAAAVPALLGAFKTAGTGSYRAPSNFIFVGTEQALVTDFDVEVAQAAVIADPVITHVREGAQLEVRVIAVAADLVIKQKVVIGRALDRLTGQAFGPDEKMWQLWWDTLGSKE